MADTMAFALVGALVFTLTFVPVLASYWFKKGVQEKQNRIFDLIRDLYGTRLDWCLNHPKSTVLAAAAIFGSTLLHVPFIGGEFLPHLDEGVLWVRATMPYTIGFEATARFAPQVRILLAQYPMVTVVGWELGGPDDGTDRIGFFNCEFYFGLKPYGDKSWKSSRIHTKEELIRDLEKKLDA